MTKLYAGCLALEMGGALCLAKAGVSWYMIMAVLFFSSAICLALTNIHEAILERKHYG